MKMSVQNNLIYLTPESLLVKTSLQLAFKRLSLSYLDEDTGKNGIVFILGLASAKALTLLFRQWDTEGYKQRSGETSYLSMFETALESRVPVNSKMTDLEVKNDLTLNRNIEVWSLDAATKLSLILDNAKIVYNVMFGLDNTTVFYINAHDNKKVNRVLTDWKVALTEILNG